MPATIRNVLSAAQTVLNSGQIPPALIYKRLKDILGSQHNIPELTALDPHTFQASDLSRVLGHALAAPELQPERSLEITSPLEGLSAIIGGRRSGIHRIGSVLVTLGSGTPQGSFPSLGSGWVEKRQGILDLTRDTNATLMKLCGLVAEMLSSVSVQTGEDGDAVVAELPSSLENLKNKMASFEKSSGDGSELEGWEGNLLIKMGRSNFMKTIETFRSDWEGIVQNRFPRLHALEVQIRDYIKKLGQQLDQIKSLITGEDEKTPARGVGVVS
jgi:hypothetical protein